MQQPFNLFQFLIAQFIVRMTYEISNGNLFNIVDAFLLFRYRSAMIQSFKNLSIHSAIIIPLKYIKTKINRITRAVG